MTSESPFVGDIATTLIEAIVVLPILGYVFWGRPYRRRMILGYFTSSAIADYFDQFWAGFDHYGALSSAYRTARGLNPNSAETAAAAAHLRDALFDLYNRRFGWRSYFVPLLVLGTIIWVEGSLVSQFAAYWLHETAVETIGGPDLAPATNQLFRQLPDKLTVAALAGAYLWVGLNLISRVSSLSLLPSDINYYSLRLVIAPALGFAFSAAAGSLNATILVAFAVTLLPISDLMTWLRSLAAKSLNVTDSPQDAADKLINLPGVDADLAARFQDQSITTVRQFADADPVQLSMRSGLDFAFIVSLVDEALAWPFFGKKLLALSSFGWSGVSDIIDTASDQASGATPEQAAIGFCSEKAALDTANAAVAAAAPEAQDYVELVQRQAAAQHSFDSAQAGLRNAIAAFPLMKLTTAIADVQDLHLTEVGVHNIALRISKDSYAKFIRRLVREIQAQSNLPVTQQAPSKGLLPSAINFVVGLGEGVKSFTRRLGEP